MFNDDDLIYKIKYVYKLLNGKTLKGNNAVYRADFKKARYSAILLAFVSLNLFRKEQCPDNCNIYRLYKLNKVAQTLSLDFDKTRVAKKIYEEMANLGEVKLERKKDKEYICITEKGRNSFNKQLGELHRLKKYFEEIPQLQDKFDAESPSYPSKGLHSVDSNVEKIVEDLIHSISGESPRENKKALVIGISDYSNLQSLHFCKNDGETMYKILSSLNYELFDNLIGYVKWDIMRDAIFDFFSDPNIKPSDTLIFYHSKTGYVIERRKHKTYELNEIKNAWIHGKITITGA